MFQIFLYNCSHHICSAGRSTAKKNESDSHTLDHTAVKSCKQEVITGKIPYRLKGQPCRQRNFSYQCFLYKRETMYLPSDQKQWNIQSNIGYPKRDSTVNDSFCPGLYDNRYTGKPPVTIPDASNTELIANDISPVPTIIIKYSSNFDFFPFANFIFRLLFLSLIHFEHSVCIASFQPAFIHNPSRYPQAILYSNASMMPLYHCAVFISP